MEFKHIPKLDTENLYTVTREDAEADFEAVLEIAKSGHSPLLIRSPGKDDLLLFTWEDYWERFEPLYPEGAKEEFEEACRTYGPLRQEEINGKREGPA